MDPNADHFAALTAHLDLKDVVHVGYSTGGGEVAHYLARHGESYVAKAAPLPTFYLIANLLTLDSREDGTRATFDWRSPHNERT